MEIQTGSFILSAPSWVIPGTYAENLRFLEDKTAISGVELLFFIYDDEIKTQLNNEWDEIFSYRERFVFTAHLPELLHPDHEELIIRLTPLVRHFIVHPDINNPAAQALLLADWTKRHGAVFLTENTNPGSLEILLPYLDTGSGLCMDTGHLLLEGQDPAVFFKTYRERINEIHLHGINSEKAAVDGRLRDHRSFGGNEGWLRQLLPLLGDYRGVVNLEMFSWEEIEQSITSLITPE